MMQDMFLAAIVILDRLVSVPAQAADISQMTASVRQMEAVAQILLRRVDTESKYLARLEGNLGPHAADSIFYWRMVPLVLAHHG